MNWIIIPKEKFKAFSKISDENRKIAVFKNDFFIDLKFIRGDLMDIFTSLAYSGIDYIYYNKKLYPSLSQMIKKELFPPRYERLAIKLKQYCEDEVLKNNRKI